MKLGVVMERVAIGVASVALAVGLIAILSGYFSSRDQPGVSGGAGGPGQSFVDLGHAHLQPGQPAPAYDSDPPTSGAHLPVAVPADGRRLSDNQLLEALELGDVVIMYGTPAPPPGLAALAHAVAGPFTPALAASGQSVILARRPGTAGLIGLAWTHMVRVSAADDPLLREFSQFWVGKGAPGH